MPKQNIKSNKSNDISIKISPIFQKIFSVLFVASWVVYVCYFMVMFYKTPMPEGDNSILIALILNLHPFAFLAVALLGIWKRYDNLLNKIFMGGLLSLIGTTVASTASALLYSISSYFGWMNSGEAGVLIDSMQFNLYVLLANVLIFAIVIFVCFPMGKKKVSK